MTGEAVAMDSRLSTQIYETLRRRIILGEILPGARLTEQRLAEELDVSRVPLREALPQLEVDGFVTSIPRRGSIVTEWTNTAVNDLFDTRLALEPAAARLAAIRASRVAGVGDELRRAVDEADTVLDGGDDLQVAIANTRVHQAFVDAAGNSMLSALMRATGGRMTWLFYLSRSRDPLVACTEHHEIADAISDGNDQLASVRMYAHIEAGRVPSLAAMQSLMV